MSGANNSVLEKPKPRNPGWSNIKPAKKGEVRNPTGRGIGSRNKLADAFIADVHDKWQVQGPTVLDETIKRKPWEFVKIVAGLMPQKLEITNKFQSLPDAELADALSRAIKELATGTNGRTAFGRPGDQGRIIEATAQSLPAVPEADSVPSGRSEASGTAPDGGQPIGEDLCRRS
jgi:hypothetical protein